MQTSRGFNSSHSLKFSYIVSPARSSPRPPHAALTAERRMPRAAGNVGPVWRVGPWHERIRPRYGGGALCVVSERRYYSVGLLQCAAALAVVATERAFLRAL